MKRYFLLTLLLLMFNYANAFELNLFVLKLKIDQEGFRVVVPTILDSHSPTMLKRGSLTNKGSIEINILF